MDLLRSKKGQGAAIGAWLRAIPGRAVGHVNNNRFFYIVLVLYFITFLFDSLLAFGGAYFRLMTYLGFAVLVSFFAFTSHAERGVTYPQLVMAVIMFLLPWALRWFALFPTKVGIIMIFAFLVWLFIIDFSIPHDRSWVDIAVSILFILCVFSFIYWIMPQDYIQTVAEETLGIEVEYEAISAWESVVLAKDLIWSGIKDLFTKTSDELAEQFQRQVAYATGDLYVSKVDKAKQGPVGIFLENLQPSSQAFLENEPVTVWATLRGQSNAIDEEKELSLTVSCAANDLDDKSKRGIIDHVNTDDVLELKFRGYDETDLQCRFDGGKMSKGFNKVLFTSDFNFTTFSYLKTYFISDKKNIELRSQNIDPFDEFKIADRQPQTEYSEGPVSVAIGIGPKPIETGTGAGRVAMVSFSPTLDNRVKFGVTLGNRWGGKIKKVNDFKISLPNSLKIEYCDHGISARPCSGSECTENYNTVYALTQDSMDSINNEFKTLSFELWGMKFKGLSAPFFTFNCFLTPANSEEEVLGNYIVASHYIKAEVDYIYSIEAQKPVNIVKGYIAECKDDSDVGKQCGQNKVCTKKADNTYSCLSICDYKAVKKEDGIDETWSCKSGIEANYCKTHQAECKLGLCPGTEVCIKAGGATAEQDQLCVDSETKAVKPDGTDCGLNMQCSAGKCKSLCELQKGFNGWSCQQITAADCDASPSGCTRNLCPGALYCASPNFVTDLGKVTVAQCQTDADCGAGYLGCDSNICIPLCEKNKYLPEDDPNHIPDNFQCQVDITNWCAQNPDYCKSGLCPPIGGKQAFCAIK